MKYGFKTAVAVMAVASLGALAGCTHGHQGHDPKQIKKHVKSALKKIGATEQQQASIAGIADRIIADGGNIQKNCQGLRQKFVTCLLLDTPNREWLHQTVDEKALEFTAFAHRTVDSLLEASATLTPEQRAELRKRIESAHCADK